MPNKNNAPAMIPTCHPNRPHLAKGLCKACYDSARAAINRENLNASKRKWAKENPERVKAIKRKHLYGIDASTVQARLNAQDGKCKICMAAPAEHLDHDHASGKTRSLLCGPCNRALGMLKEDPERMRRAILYLELWDDRAVQVIANTGQPVGVSTRGLA